MLDHDFFILKFKIFIESIHKLLNNFSGSSVRKLNLRNHLSFNILIISTRSSCHLTCCRFHSYLLQIRLQIEFLFFSFICKVLISFLEKFIIRCSCIYTIPFALKLNRMLLRKMSKFIIHLNLLYLNSLSNSRKCTKHLISCNFLFLIDDASNRNRSILLNRVVVFLLATLHKIRSILQWNRFEIVMFLCFQRRVISKTVQLLS